MTINVHLILSWLKHALLAKRRGHGVHSPFVYKLCEEVFYNEAAFYRFGRLNKLREHLLKDETVLDIEDFGAGSKVLKNKQRKVLDIARHGISSAKQSELLFRLVNYLNPKACLELGTSLGLNALYLASANSAITITTVEGSKALANYAKALAKKEKYNNVDFVNDKFDSALDNLMQQTQADFIYVDGNHTYAATLNYFNTLLHHRQTNMVIIFDDIYWSSGMTRAWKEISQNREVVLSIDLFYMGLVFFKSEFKDKTHYRLYL